MRLLVLFVLPFLAASINADASAGGLYPPGLLPLVNRANALLTAGLFNDAVKAYTEAIEQSPADYLLYWKRATAHYSLNRHAAALEDYDKVISLTSNSFDSAHLMKARVHTKEGQFDLAHAALARYLAKNKSDHAGLELLAELKEAEATALKTTQARQSQLWTTCVDFASETLKTAGFSIEIRQMRAECALGAGDIESTVADMTRLSSLLPPATDLQLRIFRLSFFLLPPSPSTMNSLKQCLHSDPESKPCLALHRVAKNFDRGFTKLDELHDASNWDGIVNLLTGVGKNNNLMQRFDEAIAEHAQPEQLLPPLGDVPGRAIPIPDPYKASIRRQTLVRSLCKAYTHLGDHKKAGKWCEMILTMDGCAEDIDGLVGQGESLLIKEEWEEAVRVFEKAFEASGRSNRDIHQRLQKAQRLLKQSRQKDYYKVLGVPRDADDRTIKKAFRTAAKDAHPDKGGSEAKMAAVNEAYEVLSDPELRQRFDNGDDPNDPTSGQGGHPFPGGFTGSGHPFAQFFQQSGDSQQSGGFRQFFQGSPGGGFQFHFGR
ncbi:DnaJ-domain-containing protein [Fistulina hepatica ATCC 64428]|nr:DnaJ-domain-containing protein [Fistulina hepatica ATCC 64428]